MYTGNLIFSQVMAHLPMHTFRRCVRCYRGHHKVKTFTCLDQFLCLAFAQLTYRESLRDIEACLRAQHHKLYHMGIRGGISRNTLAHANQTRDWRIYADFAQPIHTARFFCHRRAVPAQYVNQHLRGELNYYPNKEFHQCAAFFVVRAKSNWRYLFPTRRDRPHMRPNRRPHLRRQLTTRTNSAESR